MHFLSHALHRNNIVIKYSVMCNNVMWCQSTNHIIWKCILHCMCVCLRNKELSVLSVFLSLYQGDLDCGSVNRYPHTPSVIFHSIHSLFLLIILILSVCQTQPIMLYFSTWVSIGSLTYIELFASLSNTHTHIYTLYTCLHTIDGNLYKWISHSGESQVSIFFCPTKLCPVLYWEQNSERRTNTHNIFSRISQGSSYKLNSLGYF